MSLKRVLLAIIIETFIWIVAAQINLAPQGVALQSSTYPNYPANLAIEGPANNKWKDGCSATAAVQRYAWWGLKLPAVAHMTNILIYYREGLGHPSTKLETSAVEDESRYCIVDADAAQRMNEFRLYLENGTTVGSSILNRCYTDQGKPGLPALTQNITCNMLAKNMYFFNRRSDATCFLQIRQPNKPILKPNHPASFAIDGNRTNGLCSSLTGPDSYLQIDTGSLSVVTTVYFTFGDVTVATGEDVVYCSNTSDSWVVAILLYKGERPTKDINVFAVCRYIIYVPPAASGVDVCEMEIGGCPLGRYGYNCEKFCHCNGPCDLGSGYCSSGCLDGWTGNRCDIVCDNGYFGKKCTRPCSANCLNPPCNHVSGECAGGCSKGWEGYNCTKECDDWKFGIDCANKCNCRTVPCNTLTGICSNRECARGWNGESCDKDHSLQTEDVYLNVENVQDSDNAKPSVFGKKKCKTSVIEVKDEYPEKYEEEEEENEEEGNVYNNVASEQNITKYKIQIADLKTSSTIKEKMMVSRMNMRVIKEKAYIASQEKCEQYWPKTVNKATMVDNYRLTMTEETYHTIYVYRLIILHNKTNQQERKVHHFHFTQWPDHGVPDSVKVVNFLQESEKQDIAGVGRTGTFIAIDALYEHGKTVGYVDIMEYVQMMRKTE
ncbi:unnamed protein product [Mytilus edulis]|uniref:Uncharacterized protein n=1 Tax=Mytilus edulis TaxID=6550 RepID=A0A8S3RL00_MYTED|nr:unnamed protein product [Mytilus edulis]